MSSSGTSLASSDDPIDAFADLVSRADDAIHVPSAALSIARVEYPDLDVYASLARLDELGERAASQVDADPGDPLGTLNGFVFDELGFRGDREHYFDPRNSFLNDVVERRRGIPITLAVVHIELAAHAGIEIEGVGFPSHFLAREVATGRLVDCFEGGRIVDEADCRAILERQGLGHTGLRPEFLATVGPRQILARMLNNLMRLYADVGSDERLARFQAMAAVLEAVDADGPGMVH